MNSETMRTLPCHGNIIQRKVKIFSKAAARPLRFLEARIIITSLAPIMASLASSPIYRVDTTKVPF